MATEPIRCPGCGAGDPSDANAAGVHTCIYCGTRYRLRGGVGHVIGSAEAAAQPRVAAAIAISLLVMGAGIAAFLVVDEAPPPDAPAPRQPAPRPPVEAPPSNPALAIEAATEAPTPEKVDATAEFVEHHRKESGGATWIYGMVTNTSPFVVDKVEVIAVLLGADGEELGTKSGFAKRDALGPGATSPVIVLLKDAPEFASIEWELDVDKATWVPEMVEGLRVEAGPPSRAQFGGWEAEGKVFHDGDTPARFVKVELQGWSADGKLLGVHDTYIKDDVLQPGDSSRFKHVGAMFDVSPARFEMVVEGRKAE